MGCFSDGDRHESSSGAGGAKFIGVDHISLMAAALRKLVFCYPANLALAVLRGEARLPSCMNRAHRRVCFSRRPEYKQRLATVVTAKKCRQNKAFAAVAQW